MTDINLKHKHDSLKWKKENEEDTRALLKFLLNGDLDGDLGYDFDREDIEAFKNAKNFKDLNPFVDPRNLEDRNYRDFGPSERFIINPENRAVTYLSDFEDPVIVKTHPEDDFDKYIGAALAYVYAEFGSKTQFRKFVDEHSKELKSREERKEDKKKHKIAKTPIKTKKTHYYATDVKVEAFQKDQQGNYTLAFSTQPAAADSAAARDGEQDFRYLIGKPILKTRGRPAKKVSK